MFKSSGIIAKVSKKIAVVLLCVALMMPRAGRAVVEEIITCTATSTTQLVMIGENAIGFLLIGLLTDVGEPVASSWGDFSESNEEVLGALHGALEAQSNAFMRDNDDFEQLTEARFFARTTADAAKLTYLHRIASALGSAGSGAEDLSQPLYAGNSVYDFHKQVLNANFVLRRDNLGYLIEGTDVNLIDFDPSSLCNQLPEGLPGNFFSFCGGGSANSDSQNRSLARVSIEELKQVREKIALYLKGEESVDLSEQEMIQAIAMLQSLEQVSY